MTRDAYGAYVEREIRGYAEQNVASGRWNPAEAPARAAADFERLLPQGLESPGQFIFEVEDVGGPTRVGHLWIAIDPKETIPQAFVYSLAIHPEHQRRGFGEAAMKAAERFAIDRGARRIGLNVFGHNDVAHRLYARLGYRTVAELMGKELAPAADWAARPP